MYPFYLLAFYSSVPNTTRAIITSPPQSTAGHRLLQSLAISLDLRLLASSPASRPAQIATPPGRFTLRLTRLNLHSKAPSTANSTSDYTLWTLYRSCYKNISANIEMKGYSGTSCWPCKFATLNTCSIATIAAMEIPWKSSFVHPLSFYTNHASNAIVVRVVLLDANSYLALRTRLPPRLSVLRLIWPAHCHFIVLIRCPTRAMQYKTPLLLIF
jgi:hypothetical protein